MHVHHITDAKCIKPVPEGGQTIPEVGGQTELTPEVGLGGTNKVTDRVSLQR